LPPHIYHDLYHRHRHHAQQQQQQQQQGAGPPNPEAASTSGAGAAQREFRALGSRVVESNVAFQGPEDMPDMWEGENFDVSLSITDVGAGLV
jgi:hypothetical protein